MNPFTHPNPIFILQECKILPIEAILFLRKTVFQRTVFSLLLAPSPVTN